jgi:hypothetical protein
LKPEKEKQRLSTRTRFDFGLENLSCEENRCEENRAEFEVIGNRELLVEMPLLLGEVWEELQPPVELSLPKIPSGLKSLMSVRYRRQASHSHVHPILFLSGHSPLLLPNLRGLAVGNSCPTPPDQRASKGAAWARSTYRRGPPLVGIAAAPVVRLAFCAHHRQAGNGHCLASPRIPPVVDLEG